MKPPSKLSGEDRRAAIIRAVRRVFAEKGFHGTTTRALADAAGVSEALLFKHFPNKEALYSAMQQACNQDQEVRMAEWLQTLEPSTSSLVFLVHMMISRILECPSAGSDDESLQTHLMLRSMMED